MSLFGEMGLFSGSSKRGVGEVVLMQGLVNMPLIEYGII